MQKSIVFSVAFFDEWERPIWPPSIVMMGTAEIFGFTFDIQMRYLVYMRYLWVTATLVKIVNFVFGEVY